MVTPITIKFTPTSKGEFQRYLRNNLRPTINGLRDIHETKLQLWRRIYNAEPLEAVRHVPFENASNLVVPIAAIHADTLQARIMAAIFNLRPIWILQLAGDFEGEGDKLRSAAENYLTDLALEPEKLDLYRVYRDFLGDVIKYGTSVIKQPWENLTEAMAVPAGDGTGSYALIDEVVYDDPRPEKILFEDIFIPPQTLTLDKAFFKAHRRRLTYPELMTRKQRGLYDALAVQLVLGAPDRSGPTPPQREQEAKAGAQTIQDEVHREWDIYECWCIYNLDGHNVRVIATYHERTDTLLRAVFSFFPTDPWVGARLFSSDGMYFGDGMIKKLSMIQEDISKNHNERHDAQTVAHAKIWRIDPNSKLMEGFDIFPSAKVPAEKDEFEAIAHGEPLTTIAIDDERLSIDLAERLSGVSPPQQGYGATGSKKGAYSAMGTLSLLQEGNTRTDLHVSDIRDAHLRLGRMVSKQIAHLGLSASRFKAYGKTAVDLMAAFEAIRDNRMYMPVLAATSSINREVEKQSDILLVGMAMKHYQTIASLIAQVNSGMTSPELKEYLAKSIKAANALMSGVLRHFGIDEPSRLVPEVDTNKMLQEVAKQPQDQGQGGNQPPELQPPSQSVPMPTNGGGMVQ